MELSSSLILVKELYDWRAVIDILLMAAGLFFLCRKLRPEKVKVFSPVSESKAKSVSVMTTPIGSYLQFIFNEQKIRPAP